MISGAVTDCRRWAIRYFPGLPGNGTMKFEERDSFQKVRGDRTHICMLPTEAMHATT
jgi:hypothetical protein